MLRNGNGVNIAELRKLFLTLQGTQNIDGIKKFQQFPYTPQTAPTEDYQVVNKAYADSATHLIGDSWRLRADGATLYLEYDNAGSWTTIGSWSFP